MKSKIYLLLSLLLLGCSSSQYTINLKLVPLGKSDGDNKLPHHKLVPSLRVPQSVNISEWKKIRVLYNEYEDKIVLVNPNIKNSNKIILLKDEAILISDILMVLNFNNERDFFNSLENTLKIYPYKESDIGSKNKYIYFNHIYGITVSDKQENKKKSGRD